jgi:predicted alpha/beta superfamily hydrolase
MIIFRPFINEIEIKPMKKNIFIVLLLFSVFSFGQTKMLKYYSEKLAEERTLIVKLPDSYEKNPNRKYPTMVLMDGDVLLDPFWGAIKFSNAFDEVPEVILVGIMQNGSAEQRNLDTSIDENMGVPFETGASFFDFIHLELMPYLESKFRIAPFKILAGHDNTATFANFSLYKKPHVFDALIVLSPFYVNNMEENVPILLNESTKKMFYYHAISQGGPKSIKESEIRVKNAIQAIENPKFDFKFDVFENSNQNTVVMHAIPNALQFIFNIYQPISLTEFQTKITVLESGYVDYLTQKYETIKIRLGIEIPIRFTDFKAIETAILKNNKLDEFEKLAVLAKKQFPKSLLYDYYMGLMYELKGDYRKAEKAYIIGFQKESIGDLKKNYLLERSELIKNLANTN